MYKNIDIGKFALDIAKSTSVGSALQNQTLLGLNSAVGATVLEGFAKNYDLSGVSEVFKRNCDSHISAELSNFRLTAKNRAFHDLESSIGTTVLEEFTKLTSVGSALQNQALLGLNSAAGATAFEGFAKNFDLSGVSEIFKRNCDSHISAELSNFGLTAKNRAFHDLKSSIGTSLIDQFAKDHTLFGDVSQLLEKNLDSHLKSIVEIAKSIDLDALRSMGYDSTNIAQDYDQIDKNTVHQQLESITQAKDSETLSLFFRTLPNWLKSSLIHIFYVLLLLSSDTINAVFNSIIDSYVKEHIACHLPYVTCEANSTKPINDQPLRDRIKSLRTLPIEGLDLSYSRFVSTEYLDVYTKPNQKSQILDELVFGQVVIVLIKERNWTEVAFRNENGEIQEGWVLNRYLKKLNF